MSLDAAGRSACATVLAAALLCAQGLPPEVIALTRIRDGVRRTFEQLPDCTCVETVNRYLKPAGKSMQAMDRMVLETLFTGDEELFASPGDAHWNTDPATFIASGLIGNGLFASHLKSVFLNNVSITRYHGEESAGGRRESRYDFSISQNLSGYQVHSYNVTRIVATEGSFWADPETHELRRLEFHAVEMPPELMYLDLFTAITYGHVRVGERDILLPQTAVLEATDIEGGVKRDLIEFTHCRGFQTESTLHFEDEPVPPPSRGPALFSSKADQALPAGLRLTITLAGPLSDQTAVGSLIEGKIVGAVMQKGKVLVPDGATVKGRVRRLEHYADSGDGLIGEYYAVGLEFMRIELPAASLRFYAAMQDVDRAEGIQMSTFGGSREKRTEMKAGPTSMIQIETRHDSITAPDVPGVGTFFVRRPHFFLPAGFKLVWKTEAFPGQ